MYGFDAYEAEITEFHNGAPIAAKFQQLGMPNCVRFTRLLPGTLMLVHPPGEDCNGFHHTPEAGIERFEMHLN